MVVRVFLLNNILLDLEIRASSYGPILTKSTAKKVSLAHNVNKQ